MFAGGQRNWNKSVRVEIQFLGKSSQLHAALTRISKLRQFFIGNLRNEDDGGWRKIIKGDIGFRFGREREKRSWYYFSFIFFVFWLSRRESFQVGRNWILKILWFWLRALRMKKYAQRNVGWNVTPAKSGVFAYNVRRICTQSVRNKNKRSMW